MPAQKVPAQKKKRLFAKKTSWHHGKKRTHWVKVCNHCHR